MSAPNSRKRAAPGASPIVPIQQPMQQQYATGDVGSDQLMRWQPPANNTGFDQNIHGANAYGYNAGQPQAAQPIAGPSNTLARRQGNRALVPTSNVPNLDSSVEQWNDFGDENAILPQNNNAALAETDSVEMLEQMAQKTKRRMQADRKQIPPFIQKLSSFLKDEKNKGFIRWSQNGDSFIVLDEDVFAKRLIPELFKHNNYASFVRQLNMYGFHKRVGLSDNSMRASERKNKSPSEYSNPLFRRDHPNLLWLIKKPNKNKKGGKNVEGEADSDEEAGHEDGPDQELGTSGIPPPRSLPAAESQSLPKKDLTLVREDLNHIREQQNLIHSALAQLQRNNNNLYNQSLMFQKQHDRHQNSINAILLFVANVFRGTLEDQGNAQSVNDIISSMITNQNQQGTQPGSVVDLGDFFQNQTDPTTMSPPKRARGLLPPIPDYNDRAQPSTSTAPSTNQPYQLMGNQDPEMGHVTELPDGSPAETPPNLRQELESNPQERMMRIINDHNATNSSGMDLPEAAELVANAPDTLSTDQRSHLVNFMAGQSASPSTAQTPATAGPSGTGATPSNTENPDMASLSPIMRSPSMQPPSLQNINDDQVDISRLQRLQSEQAVKINELSEMLGPLSPSGQIPGLGDPDPYMDGPNVDMDQYFNSDAFLNDSAFGGDGNDFNFNLDADGNEFDASRVANAGNGNDTPSPTGTEEIQRDDLGANGASDGANKRRRVD